MTGNRAEADDLCQDAIARAIERSAQVTGDDPTGWLLRLTTRVCLDHLRHERVVRRVAELVDPVDLPEWTAGETRGVDPECATILRDDVRYAIVVALQSLTSKQRAVLVLHDICERPLREVAAAIETNENSVKALLHRARVALRKARRREDVDMPVNVRVVEEFARALEHGSIERITELLAEDVWGVVDGGGVIQTATKPTFGRRAVSRQWANAKTRLNREVAAEIRRINGEPAIVIRLAERVETIVAIVHFETRAGRIVALRINRDPQRIAWLGAAVR
jgi:RNA polymerase sigma-70 factor (ECF subfamily)